MSDCPPGCRVNFNINPFFSYQLDLPRYNLLENTAQPAKRNIFMKSSNADRVRKIWTTLRISQISEFVTVPFENKLIHSFANVREYHLKHFNLFDMANYNINSTLNQRENLIDVWN